MTKHFKPRYSMFYPSRSLGLLQIVLVLVMLFIAFPIVGISVKALLGEPYHLKVFDISSPSLSWLLALGFTALLEWLAWLLLRVVRNAAQGRVFEWQNVKNLRVLGWAFIVYWLTPVWFVPFVTHKLTIGGTISTSVTNLITSPFTIALLFFAFSEVLRQGIRLREEQELTI